MRGVTGRRAFLVVSAAIAILVVSGTMVVATHQFTDVPNGAYYHDDVDAIKDAGITGGCNAAGTKYCPNDFVKRGDMAIFINKVGALGAGTTPVTTAARLGGKEQKHLDGFVLSLPNDDAYHTLIDDQITVPQSCRLFLMGSLSSFTGNFTDYRRLFLDFFVDGVAVGMETIDDNDNVTSTFSNVAITAFQATVTPGVHTVELKGKLTTGTNVLQIWDPNILMFCL